MGNLIGKMRPYVGEEIVIIRERGPYGHLFPLGERCIVEDVYEEGGRTSIDCRSVKPMNSFGRHRYQTITMEDFDYAS